MRISTTDIGEERSNRQQKEKNQDQERHSIKFRKEYTAFWQVEEDFSI